MGAAGAQGWGEERTARPCPQRSPSLGAVPPELMGDSDLLTNVTAALHSPLTLLCEATGVPPPAVRWFREEEPIDPGEDTYLLAGETSASAVTWWPGVAPASASVHHSAHDLQPRGKGSNRFGKGFLLCSPPDSRGHICTGKLW